MSLSDRDLYVRTRGRLMAATVMLGLSLLLGACGFHLRGGVDLTEVGAVYVDSVGGQQGIGRDLNRILQAVGADVVEQAADAEFILRISYDKITRKVLSVGNGGRILEYALIYQVNMGVDGAEGKVVLPVEKLILMRDYLNDEENVLGTTAEAALLKEELRRDMVQYIMRKLNVAIRSQQDRLPSS